MKAIVTVKLPRNPKHNPKRKLTGNCPLSGNCICTDTTGSHHSYVETGDNHTEIKLLAQKKYGHITRIEIMEK